MKSIVEVDRKFPEDEIIRIAYHFINAEGENEVEVVESIDKRKEILRNVEEVLKGYAIQRTKENNHFYDRFMIHLNYFFGLFRPFQR